MFNSLQNLKKITMKKSKVEGPSMKSGYRSRMRVM